MLRDSSRRTRRGKRRLWGRRKGYARGTVAIKHGQDGRPDSKDRPCELWASTSGHLRPAEASRDTCGRAPHPFPSREQRKVNAHSPLVPPLTVHRRSHGRIPAATATSRTCRACRRAVGRARTSVAQKRTSEAEPFPHRLDLDSKSKRLDRAKIIQRPAGAMLWR